MRPFETPTSRRLAPSEHVAFGETRRLPAGAARSGAPEDSAPGPSAPATRAEAVGAEPTTAKEVATVAVTTSIEETGERDLGFVEEYPLADRRSTLQPRTARPGPNGASANGHHPGGERRTAVSLVIPAKNEARNLAHVLERLPDCVDEVILVDGRSSDVTRLMAHTCRSDVRILTEAAQGKGHALRAGFEAARGDVIVAMDADGSMSPEEIPQYLYFLEHGYDFVKGSRFVAGGGSLDITLIRKLGNRALLAAANLLFEGQFSDLCYGFFAFHRKFLRHLGLRSAGFEIETELVVRAHVLGLRIAEVPSIELPRRGGHSNLHAFRDGQRVLRTLVSERFHPSTPQLPMRRSTDIVADAPGRRA